VDTELYSLDDPLSNIAFRGTTDKESYEHMLLAKRGDHTSKKVVVVRHDMGRQPLDFIWVSLEPIIHERVVELLTSLGATGWSTYPVEVLDRDGQVVQGYHGLSVTGRCASIFFDKEHSELVYEEAPMALVPMYRGLYVTRASWDGSDLFTCADRRTDYTIVTERVRTTLSKAKVTNVRMVAISEARSNATDQPSIPRPREQGLVR
jgi:hypothetical protein